VQQLVVDATQRTGIPHLEDASEDEIDDVAISSLGGGVRGKASKVDVALPASLYLILKYGKDGRPGGFLAAARANVMVGGDSGARAMAIGMVLGAVEGVQAIPFRLQNELEKWAVCERDLVRLPVLAKARAAAEAERAQKRLNSGGSGDGADDDDVDDDDDDDDMPLSGEDKVEQEQEAFLKQQSQDAFISSSDFEGGWMM
jgi:hypothetical protein